MAPSSTVTTLDANFLISVTWTAFLHSGVAQDVLDPPTYLESAVDSAALEPAVDSTLEATVDSSTLEAEVDSALEALPREVVINRWHEFRALQNNGDQINEAAEYNPWGSKANLVPSSQWL